MAYVDPPTFVASDPLAAAELNVLSDDIRDLDARVQGTTAQLVSLSRSTDQGTADGVPEYIVWTTEVEDVGGWWSSGSKIIVPASAIPDGATSIALRVEPMVTFALDPAGARIVRIHVNGSSVRQRSQSADGGEATIIDFGKTIVVEAADEIEIEMEQSSGGSLNMTAAAIDIWRIGVVA